MKFSFIIPVYNRPEELKELLESFLLQNYESNFPYEIIIGDDGSEKDLSGIIKAYETRLPLHYFKKENTGPGDTRNQAMRKAKGEFLIILDSDIILPPFYFKKLNDLYEKKRLAPMGGGPDMSRNDFSLFQRAVDLAMTSFLSTGGIRGKKKNVMHYVPRSFNMIVHRRIFETTGGFGDMHPGEDPDWVYRAREAGFITGFYPELAVFHKRRINPAGFYKQLKNFGMARIVLNKRFPQFASPVYWFPFFYTTGIFLAFGLLFWGIPYLFYLFVLYWALLISEFIIKSRSVKLAFLAWIVFQIQMIAYAYGFMTAFFKIQILKKNPEMAIPEIFFNLKNKNSSG